jgi:hypothetical protein
MTSKDRDRWRSIFNGRFLSRFQGDEKRREGRVNHIRHTRHIRRDGMNHTRNTYKRERESLGDGYVLSFWLY